MVSIRGVVDKIGGSVSRSLLGVYLYTGCDYTGRFITIPKARALNTFISMKRQEDKVRYAVTDLVDIGKLRWKLYTKHENITLPPTDTALRFHKMRAKYVNIMFKKALQSFTPSLPLVTDCG